MINIKNSIDFVLAWSEGKAQRSTAVELATHPCINHLYIVSADKDGEDDDNWAEKVTVVHATGCCGTKFFRQVALKAKADYVALYLKPTALTLGYRCLERMMQAACEADAVMVYADHYSVKDGVTELARKIDYQIGSLRDDFDFGGLVLVKTSALKQFFETDKVGRYRYAAFYGWRLHL